MDFSIIIPAFNEKERLPPFMLSLVTQMQKINLKGEIIIVDDGGSNHDYLSYSELTRVSDIPVRVIRHNRNLGKGAAIKTGFKSAEGAWVGFVDADGATPSREVIRLIEIACASDFDGVFGSRILMLGYMINRKFMRHLFGRIFATITDIIFKIPIYDSQCGCKFFKKNKIAAFLELCVEKRYLFDIELIAAGYAKGLNFIEVPISWKEMPGSKVHFIKDGIKMIFGLLFIRKRLIRAGILQ